MFENHFDWFSTVAFSRVSKLVATAFSNCTVRPWDTLTGAERNTLKGHSGVVSSVAFSPDDKLVASASSDKTVRLWDSTTGVIRNVRKLRLVWKYRGILAR